MANPTSCITVTADHLDITRFWIDLYLRIVGIDHAPRDAIHGVRLGYPLAEQGVFRHAASPYWASCDLPLSSLAQMPQRTFDADHCGRQARMSGRDCQSVDHATLLRAGRVAP